MNLVCGALMVRADDGMMGVVERLEGELRVTYSDRGEKFTAPKSEKWAQAFPPKNPLRIEEMVEVARRADQILKAIERHEPLKYWEPLDLDKRPHDEGLVKVIVEYLTVGR